MVPVGVQFTSILTRLYQRSHALQEKSFVQHQYNFFNFFFFHFFLPCESETPSRNNNNNNNNLLSIFFHDLFRLWEIHFTKHDDLPLLLLNSKSRNSQALCSNTVFRSFFKHTCRVVISWEPFVVTEENVVKLVKLLDLQC